jgi:hypothetical protein
VLLLRRVGEQEVENAHADLRVAGRQGGWYRG